MLSRTFLRASRRGAAARVRAQHAADNASPTRLPSSRAEFCLLTETHPFYSLRQAGATPVEMSTAGAAVKDDRLTVTVDGMQVKVPPGISVLQARTAHRASKKIRT